MTHALAEYRAFLNAAGVLRHTVEVASRPNGPSVNDFRVAVADALSAVWRLPEVDPVSDEPLPSTVSNEEWHRVFAGLCDWIGESDYYSTNPNLRGEETQEVMTESVADDLADIWRDLKDALEADRQGAPWQEVVWQTRFDLRPTGASTQLTYWRAARPLTDRQPGEDSNARLADARISLKTQGSTSPRPALCVNLR